MLSLLLNSYSSSATTTTPAFLFLLFSYCDAAATVPAASLLILPKKKKMINEPKTTTQRQKTYNYFAYGSNMLSSTMVDLRQVHPIASTAAILPGYRLRFNVPGLPGIEPSWASVEEAVPFPTTNENNIGLNREEMMELVHGVMHTLTAVDFATICRTEGVPFSYALRKCRVIPYIGDGKDAGLCAWEKHALSSKRKNTMSNFEWDVSAYTLLAGPMVSSRQRKEDIPPSRSYKNVLQRGAKEFLLDESYQRTLELIPVGKTWIGDGLAEGMLQRAAKERQR